MAGQSTMNTRKARRELRDAIESAAIALETQGKFRVMKKSGRIPALEHFLHVAGGHHAYEKLLKAKDVLDKLFDYTGPKLSKVHVKKLIDAPVRAPDIYVDIQFFETMSVRAYEALNAGRTRSSSRNAHYEPMFGMYVNVNERDSCMGIYSSSQMLPFGRKIDLKSIENIDLLNTLLTDIEFKYYWEVTMLQSYAPIVMLKQIVRPTGARTFGRRTFVRNANIKSLSSPYITQRIENGEFKTKYDGAEGSCLFNIVLGVYKLVIEKSKRGKNWFKTNKLTLDGIIKGRNGGECTIDEMIEHFFKPFRLGLCVLNIQNQLMDECCYHPEMDGMKVNHHINPHVLTIVIHDNHVECCDIDDAMLRKLAAEFPFDHEALKFVNKRKVDACVECFGHFPSAFERDDKISFIKDADEIKADHGELLYDGDLAHLAKVLYCDHGVCPQVWMDGLTVNKLIVCLDDDDKKITIRNHAEAGERIGCTRPYIQFKNTLDKTYNCNSLKSYYDQDTLKVFKQNLLMATNVVVNSTPFAPRSRVKRMMVDVAGIDFNKFYLSSWMDIEQFPVSIEDDRWNKNWDGVIGENNQYWVRRVSILKNNIFTFQEEGVLDGINMVMPCNLGKFYVMAEFVPARVVKHDKTALKSIVESGENAGDIKKAVNEFFGTCYKTKRENSVARIFGDESEAAYFAEQQGLTRHAFKVIETVECVMKVENGVVIVELKVKKLWIVKTRSMVSKFCDGFVPMYSLLRNRAMAKLQMLYESLLNAGVTVHKFQTDCVYVAHDAAFKAWETANADLFEYDGFAESIGKLKKLPVEQMKFECDVKWRRKDEVRDMAAWADEKVPAYGVAYNQYSVEDEYDNKAINELIDEKKISLMLAKFPGSGKSYNTVEYVKAKGLKTMYVAYDNAASRSVRKRGDAFSTLNKFFGIGLDNERSRTMSRVCDRLEKDGFEAVVFEEVLKVDMKKVMEIRRWVQTNSSKFVIMGNGDPFQLLSEQNDRVFYNNIKNFGEYKINVVKRIFPNCLYLNQCKRFKNAKDVKKLERIFNDLFVKGMSVKDVGEKYFHVMDLDWVDQIQDDDTIISYSRMAAWRMRKEMREGMNVRCQDHTGNSNIHINDMFILAEIGEMCTLMNIADDSVECVTKHALFRFFEPEGAVTCHSVQGTTIQGRIVVAEFDSPMANDPRWFWAGLTRAEELASVVLLRGVDALDRKSIMKNIERKIVGYKAQDKKAGRECDLTNDYVYGLLRAYKLRCCECHNSVIELWEVDRKDCNIGHVVGNCQLMCMSCNRAKGAVEKKYKLKVNGGNL